MKEFLVRIFSDDSGNPSSMRIIFFFGALVYISVPSFVWLVCCLKSTPITMIPFPESVTIFYGQAMAVIMSCKVWQKNIETK